MTRLTRMRCYIVHLLFLLALATTACDSPPGNFPGTPLTPTAIVRPDAVDLAPHALFGGNSTLGTLTLSTPAPDGGLQVALSSGHEAVNVPSAVTVAAGAQTATFPVSTLPVERDVAASIEASAGGRSARATLTLWAVLPDFFSWISEAAFVNGNQAGRMTLDNATFSASCGGGSVVIQSRSGSTFWSAAFAAPLGQSLQPGVYENPDSTFSQTRARMNLNIISAPSCSAGSRRFVVHEVEIGQSSVARFRASFEESCTTSSIRGEVRVTNPVSSGTPFDRCRP